MKDEEFEAMIDGELVLDPDTSLPIDLGKLNQRELCDLLIRYGKKMQRSRNHLHVREQLLSLSTVIKKLDKVNGIKLARDQGFHKSEIDKALKRAK